MARKCKCKICKAVGTTETFYKVTNDKGVNSYYCNKEEFDHVINERSKRHSLLEYIAIEVLNYDEGQIVNPSMVKKIGELNKFYDLEVIHEAFRLNKESIQYWMNNKNFTSEYGMVNYIMKIVEGNINDVYQKWKHLKRRESKQAAENIDLEIINNMDTKTPAKQTTDSILSFLEEEDM